MNRTLLKKAQSVIDKRRQFADERARENLLIALKNEEFKKLYTKQKELEIELARKDAYGEKVDYSQINKIIEQQEHLLKNKNLNGTDIRPNYECKLCGDTGYIKGDPCTCLKQEINKVLLSFSGFTHKLATFEENTMNHPAYPLMQKWCDTQSNKLNIFIYGHTGTGKTFLTECIADRLIKNSRVTLFVTAFNLNNALLNYHISFDANRNDIIDPFLTTEVLIIDDLGSEPQLKNVTKEYLYLIINERMLNNLPTIVTTNLEPGEILTNYGERIFSRLINKKTSIAINLDGEDLRLKK